MAYEPDCWANWTNSTAGATTRRWWDYSRLQSFTSPGNLPTSATKLPASAMIILTYPIAQPTTSWLRSRRRQQQSRVCKLELCSSQYLALLNNLQSNRVTSQRNNRLNNLQSNQHNNRLSNQLNSRRNNQRNIQLNSRRQTECVN